MMQSREQRMNIIRHWLWSVCLTGFCLVGLSGCATQVQDIYDEDSPTLAQVMGQQDARVQGAVPLWSDTQLSGFTRVQANELENEFPLFPNPTIYIYIDPHITADGLPIKGMTTKARMFLRDQYALPHEIMSLSRPISGQ